jgi:hypothetical protein
VPMARGVDTARMSLEQRWSESAAIGLRALCSRFAGTTVGVGALRGRLVGGRRGLEGAKRWRSGSGTPWAWL